MPTIPQEEMEAEDTEMLEKQWHISCLSIMTLTFDLRVSMVQVTFVTIMGFRYPFKFRSMVIQTDKHSATLNAPLMALINSTDVNKASLTTVQQL